MAGTGLTGFLQNLTGGEMVIIALVALLVLGPDRLPEMARGAGRMLHKLRTMTEGMQSEVRDVMADPSMQPLKELGELAARPRQKLTEYALEAEAEERAKREAAAAEAAAAELAASEAAATDAAATDAAATDATSTDATSTDATSTDATSTDATSTDEPADDDGAEATAAADTGTAEPVGGVDSGSSNTQEHDRT